MTRGGKFSNASQLISSELPDPLRVTRDDELAQRPAGVVADERDVTEVEPLDQLGDHRRERRRVEGRPRAHRDRVRSERQIGDDAAHAGAKVRQHLVPDAAR